MAVAVAVAAVAAVAVAAVLLEEIDFWSCPVAVVLFEEADFCSWTGSLGCIVSSLLS